MSRVMPRVPLLLILLCALSFGRVFGAGHPISNSTTTRPPHLLGTVWDVPMPTLHEKMYGAHHHEHHHRYHQQGRSISALPAFAYITSSSPNNYHREYVNCDDDADLFKMATVMIPMMILALIVMVMM